MVHVADGLTPLVVGGKVTPEQAQALGGGHVPSIGALPAPLRDLFEGAFGDATGHLFLFTIPCALLALIAVLLIKENRLRTTLDKVEEPETDLATAAEPAAELGRR